MTDEILFPPHKGWDPFAPTRTLTPDGAGYRDMQNFRITNDFLKRRNQVEQPEFLTAEGLTANGLTLFTAPQEYPIHLWADLSSSFPFSLVITTSRVVIGGGKSGDGAWFTINPNLFTSSGTVTQGSEIITNVAAAAAWEFGFSIGDVLQEPFDGDVIGVVKFYDPGANEIELFGPALSSSGPKTIEVLAGIQFGRTHFRIFNGDLYVAAVWSVLGADLVGPSRHKWGVYRWTSVRNKIQGQDFTDQVWLCGNALLDGTFDAIFNPTPEISNNPNGNQIGIPNNLIDFDSSNVFIPGSSTKAIVRGLDLLQDGRVVCPVASELYDDRVFYSSQINDPQIHWNTSPGGFVDPVGIEGELMVMGRLGNQLTLHYEHGIAVATPTGQDDPPLAFQNTRELQGCTFWRTLVNINPAVEAFVGPDMALYTFNGSSVDMIGPHPKVGLPGFGTFDFPSINDEIFCSWDGYIRELSVWLFRKSGGDDKETFRVSFSFDKGMWTRDLFNFFVTAVSRDYGLLNPDRDAFNTDRERFAWVGVPQRKVNPPNPDELSEVEGILGFLSEFAIVEYRPQWVTSPVPPSFVQLDRYGLGKQTIELEYVGVEGYNARLAGGGVSTQRVIVEPIWDGNPVPPQQRDFLSPSTDNSRVYYFQDFNNTSGEHLQLRIRFHGDAANLEDFMLAMGVIRLGVNPVGEVRSEGQDVD